MKELWFYYYHYYDYYYYLKQACLLEDKPVREAIKHVAAHEPVGREAELQPGA